VVTPTSIYSIRYRGAGVHEIVQLDQSQFPPDGAAIPVRSGVPGAGGPATAADLIAKGDGSPTIDLLVVYTPAARADAVDGISSIINLGVSEANTSYIQSGVTQRVRLVHTAEVAYTEAGWNTDLFNLRTGSGALSAVSALRDAYGADLVTMVVSDRSQAQCGLAYQLTDVSSAFAPSAFSLVDQACVAGNFSLAHELGHNMGANHDWYLDNSVQPYSYAHGYVNTIGRWRTIMAYNSVCSDLGLDQGLNEGCPRLLYWSNPEITLDGAPMGIPAGTRSNCRTGDPFDVPCDADNHRVLNNTAATVASFRAAVSPVAAPGSLRFSATKAGAGGQLTAVTSAQVVTVNVSNALAAWTASANQPWIRLTNPSGTGAGQFTVSIVNPDNVLGGSTSLAATVVVTPTTAGQAPATVAVSLSVNLSGAASAPPFGQIDTPAQGAGGIVGAIGVTGWTLDDLGVSSVRIFRNCLPWDLLPNGTSNCQIVAGHQVVYVGDAAFLAGARPDVEAAFPGYPQAYRAGWGYMMLTNLLPHVPKGQAFGGQGTLSFYAFAADAEGQLTLLGRSRLDHVPTTVTLANDTIARPFGAIDTPGQGQTVSGTLANFGWVLTPDGNHVGGQADDILIPVDGSTMTVVIDGAPAGRVAYNQCRGSADIGNPVHAALFCNDDVASIFGNLTPLPTFTMRTSNPTKYRNLDVERGAIGAYEIDTRTLANGMHTIAWGVIDSAGRTEGIGSRFFTVLNSSTSAAPSAGDVALRAAAALQAAPAATRGDARSLDALTPSASEVLARTGFALQVPFEQLSPGEDGVRRVQLAALGRLELQLGAVNAGYLVANGALRDLPPGSRLNARTGNFTWMPAVGYVGTYHLAFVRDNEQIPVSVTIRPVAAAAPGESEIRMWVDLPRTGQNVSGAFTVAGWALDPQASIGTGIGAVHVWAHRLDAPGLAPVFLGAAELNGTRPDVSRAFGGQFGVAGFGLTASGLAAGRYDITAYAWNRRTARWEDARTATVIVR
jgi:hypothetical protein